MRRWARSGWATALTLMAAAASAQAAPPPRLVIVVSIDQLSADLYEQYRPEFRGGLARLGAGAWFRNAFQAQNATETCPGHSTILTGLYPARTGIVANNWTDQAISRSDKSVYCAEDEQVVGTSSTDYRVSSVHLKGQTLGALMKARWPDSRSLAVAGKDRAAVMMGGHRPDSRWYWDGKAFVSDLRGAALTRWVAATNNAVRDLVARPAEAMPTTPLCETRAKPYLVGSKQHRVGDGRFARAGGDARAFRASPQFDAMTLALTAGLIAEMKLGQGPAPDLVSIGLSGTDYVGHSFGPGGQEMCLQLQALDENLAGFFAFLDGRGLDYAVVLTADHGGEDLVERARDKGLAASRVDAALAPATMGRALAERLGLSGPVLMGESANGDIYVDRALNPAQRRRALTAALAAYRAHPQVEAVWTADQMIATPVPTGSPREWSLRQRARASFMVGRSGDLIVQLKSHVSPIADPGPGYVATHGTPWDYDRRVPILWWRKGMAAQTIDTPAATVDIMPTLAAMLGMAPGAVDGRCLTMAGLACPAAR